MSIKMIATDLDGTLLNSQHRPPVEFFDWVKRHPEIHTVIASGRQYQTLVGMFGSLGEQMTYCADNGGFIFHEGKKLYSNPIDEHDLMNAVKYMGNIPDTHLVLSGAHTSYIQYKGEEDLGDVSMYFSSLMEVEDLKKVIDKDEIVKISIYDQKHDAANLIHFLPDLGDHMQSVLSEQSWVDIQKADTSKGTAIQFLQEEYDIRPEECVCFGDYLNDTTMMESCHFSVAMANAHPKLKEIASYQATTNDSQGVVSMLSLLTE